MWSLQAKILLKSEKELLVQSIQNIHIIRKHSLMI